MGEKIRVGINGFGRIGRAIFRSNLKHKRFDVVAVNDINPDVENIVYQLNYDTIYGALDEKFVNNGSTFYNAHQSTVYYTNGHIDEVPWEKHHVDFIIDASGVYDNVLRSKRLLSCRNVPYVMVTHSPDNVDFTMVLGSNEEDFDVQKHRLISTSICDATAMAPVLRCVVDEFGIDTGYITTIHPWLSYQNLSDGPASSWANPGEIYHHFALGRAAVGNVIPKPTSAVAAISRVLNGITTEKIGSFSYRTPTAIIGSADITLFLSTPATKKTLISSLEARERDQRWNIIANNYEPLVSLDFCQCETSAVVDHRWTDVIDGKLVKLVLWYDNEWGYATRVIDQILYIDALARP